MPIDRRDVAASLPASVPSSRDAATGRHAHEPFAARLVVLGDRDAAARRARRIGLARPWRRLRSGGLLHAPRERRSRSGISRSRSPASRRDSLGSDQRARACSPCSQPRGATRARTGAFAALVTAPVQKSVHHAMPGFAFAGHTGVPGRAHAARRTSVMMLVGGAADAPLRVALVDHAPAARGRARARSRARTSTRRSRSSPRSCARKFGIARAAHRRVRPQSRTPARAAISAARRSTSSRRRSPTLRAAGHRRSRGPVPADTVFVPARARALRRDRRDVPRPGPARC